MKIVVIAGHITPALALMDELSHRRKDIEFNFFGRLHTREGDRAVSAEYALARERGIPFYALTTGRIYRNISFVGIRSLLKIPVGFIQAFYYLLKVRPDIVCSFGSYVAVPIVICAWILRIPVIAHEQTLIPGLANKVISRFAQTVALSFEETKKFYPHAHTVVTGNPLRAEVFQKNHQFVIDKTLPVIYVTGGNQGAHALNSLVFESLSSLLSEFFVIHQTGNSQVYNDYAVSVKLREKLHPSLAGRYFCFDYVGPAIIGDIYGYADVVVSRAGINTLCELWALRKKGVIFPITHIKHAEQEYNAAYFARSGLGVSLRLEDTSAAQFLAAVHTLLDTPLKETASIHVPSDAASQLAQVVLTAAEHA
jgi:UDP-N-acetylglucosamine--N-acetylmuramyl-(pentapeptide) pyrophosphoryl-undecaprenol N-acetylglucosamine transferase